MARAFDARHPADIIGAMWEKWILIATLAGSTCLMRGSIGEIVRTDAGAAMISGMLDECCRVATKSGHPPDAAAISEVRALLTDPNSTMTASMLRDMQRNSRIEADHIVGDFIRRGRECGVPTPLIEVAYAHLQVYQNTLRSGGPVSR
jgi:2-dehydropantoate 2-reductase